MFKYKFLTLVYLFSLTGPAIASLTGINVQSLYRVPFSSFRWIDISILCIVAGYFYNLKNNYDIIKKNGLIISVTILFLLFEAFQLFRTWGDNDFNYQISGFICTLSLFILIDLSTFRISTDKIISFLKFLAVAGSICLIIVNMITFYSFISGRTIITDDSFRIGLDAEGASESIYTAVIISYVYAFGLYFIQHQSKPWEKILFAVAIISIYLSLVYSFARGDMFTIGAITIIYIVVFSKKTKQMFAQVFVLAFLGFVLYLVFGTTLREKGYDPIKKIAETAEFALDVNNPDWDKGRSVPRGYAIASWKQNVWTGIGYDALYHHGAPEEFGTAHNFIITSLFHRGIIGTSIYLIILVLLFSNAIKLWFRLKSRHTYQEHLFKLLLIISFFWLVPFWNQEVIWEKYSLSMEFMYLGLITNILVSTSMHSVSRRTPFVHPTLHVQP